MSRVVAVVRVPWLLYVFGAICWGVVLVAFWVAVVVVLGIVALGLLVWVVFYHWSERRRLKAPNNHPRRAPKGGAHVWRYGR